MLIAVGALVRATGSGDACPDWPRCHGRWIPPLRHHELIEYSHRLMASILIVVVAALAVVAWRRYRPVRRVFRPAVAALGLVLFQAVLGAIVVWSRLEALNVTAHFATALLLLATLTYATVAAFSVDAAASAPREPLAVMARLSAAGAFVVLLVGALVRGEGAGLAFSGWPLMDGRLVPDVSSLPAAVHFGHRLLAGLTGLLVAWLAHVAWRARERHPAAASLAVVAASLYGVQILVGAANVWTRLSVPVVITHVVVSSLIWAALVATAASAGVRRDDRDPVTGTAT
jgi:heme a synthase